MAAPTKEKHFSGIDNLIRCLAQIKAQMEYKNIDFNADKIKQYEAVREAMARIYEEEPTFFGPPVITPMPAPAIWGVWIWSKKGAQFVC